MSGAGLRIPAPVPGKLELANVNVIPMDSRRVLPRQTVVIEDGRVRMVGPSDAVRAPGAARLDCTGKYLLPGLADMHVHYWEPTDLAMYLANGVTTVRNMRGAPLHLAIRQQVERRNLPGPRLITASPLIDGVDDEGRTTRPESLALTDPAEAKHLVERLHRRGYQQVKAYQRLRLDVLRALGQASRQVGLRMTGHCPDGVTCLQAVEAGMSCFEHLTWIPAEPDVELRRLADQLAARQIWNCPTVVVGSAAIRESEPDPQVPSLLRYQPQQIIKRWQARLRHSLEAMSDHNLTEERSVGRQQTDRCISIVSLLHQSGAPLLLGTDARNPYVFPGFAVHDELGHFVDAGLTPYQALRCATVEAACFLGEANDWGTVAEGKRADLLLVDQDPLTDLNTLRRPLVVLSNGYFLTRSNLDNLLFQREQWARQAETLPATPLPPVWRVDSQVIRAGELTETTYGAPTTRTTYRHSCHPGAGWVIEEEQASAPSGARRSVRLRLTAQGVILDGRLDISSPVGQERLECRRRPEGGYEVRLADIDGVASRSVLSPPDLVPGGTLAVSFFLALFDVTDIAGHLDGAALPALTVENGQTEVEWLWVTRSREGAVDDDDGGSSWRVCVERLGHPTTHLYQLRRGNVLVEGNEQTRISGRTWPASG